MKRLLYCVILAFFFCIDLPSQEPGIEPEKPVVECFSVWELYAAVTGGRLVWQPDWPLEIPPDVFDFNYKFIGEEQQAFSITIGYEGRKLTLSRNKLGRLTDFPFLVKGSFVQVKTAENQNGGISGLSIYSIGSVDSIEDGSPVEIEFLDYSNEGLPQLARINYSGAWCFVSFNFLNNETLETWFDVEGSPLGVLKIHQNYQFPHLFTKIETNTESKADSEYRHYDNFGKVTRIESERGIFKALYNDKGLRYWTRETGNYYLQRDEQFRLVRMSGSEDFRYEYIFDENGNWIERCGIKMLNQFGALVSVSASFIKREIEYPRD